MTKIRELFGYSTGAKANWLAVVREQVCLFLERKCLKNRKSEPDVAIGTCTVTYGDAPVVICPHRFLERGVIFTDCLPLIRHESGNELHVVPEISIPGGTVDYFLVSARNRRVRDFAGIEIQTMDTTGTVWPERQRFLHATKIAVKPEDAASTKNYGMNWKHTSKTILMQLHHKVQTFESVSRHLVLAIQDVLLDYMTHEFTIGHITDARPADPLQIHAYCMNPTGRDNALALGLVKRLSTDSAGVATALGLQEEARIELETIHAALEAKMSDKTLFRL